MSDEERKLLVDLGGLKGAPTSKPLAIVAPAPNGNLVCYYNENSGIYDDCHAIK